jgi:hypothetical protein
MRLTQTWLAAVVLIAGEMAMAGDAAAVCRIQREGTVVALEAPAFVFRLDTAEGLRAVSWENRLTGRTLELGRGPEVEFDIGLPGKELRTPQLRVVRLPEAAGEATAEAQFELVAAEPAAKIVVTYRWSAAEAVLHRTVAITNTGLEPWDRLLNVRLGSYRTDVDVADREQGFPAYLGGEFFLSLAHPAGWAMKREGGVEMRQHPGVRLAPGASFDCMEAVLGVAPAGAAREAFVAHVHSRMRRVVRGHDRPYAIFEPFGARPNGSFDETEDFVLDMVRKVGEGQRQTGCRFDVLSVDFWVDYRGDLMRCDPERFPRGLAPILGELRALGIAPGLWIDSSWELWSVGGNPAVRECLNYDVRDESTLRQVSWGRASFCRATEPIRSMYVEAFRHHLRENGVRLLKFDNLATSCANPTHAHLPGPYSTEAITDAVIEFLQALDREEPEVFLMLYWGYRSPWWLLHGDTLFDSGIGIEAASPRTQPAPYARDSITQKLDQAQRFACDVPALGKDSLGVWLSDWPWNSQVGKERWQPGFIMDLCRGSLLAQPWSDGPWLTPPERQEMADFIALLRARPACFANPRFVLGDPRRNEPYGYCCGDGQRAFLALNNCTWEDHTLTLELSPAWGLPGGQAWDLYRWYPEPARLTGAAPAFGPRFELALRPFELVLLEAVPAGGKPTLERQFGKTAAPRAFAEASRPVAVTLEAPPPDPQTPTAAGWVPLPVNEARSAGGATLAVQPDGSVLASGPCPAPDTYVVKASADLAGITGVLIEVLPDASLPNQGPGRAVNGNLMLNGLRLNVAPPDRPAESATVAFRGARADFEQTSHGGWPASAILDDNPKTGWSIFPATGTAHVALIEATRPFGAPGGSSLVFEIGQGEREHTLGRFRLWVTNGAAPRLPEGYGTTPWSVTGEAPASPSGGLLVVSVELITESGPQEASNLGALFAVQATVAGEAAAFTPVLGTQTYPSSWQAWRYPVAAGSPARAFALAVTTRGIPAGSTRWQARFLPR